MECVCCSIGLEHADGSIEAVCVIEDGGISYTGRLLLKHHTRETIQEMVDLGDLYQIGAKIGERHAFDVYYTPVPFDESICYFYGRDNGNKDVDAHHYHSREEYIQSKNHWRVGWLYLLSKDNEWLAYKVFHNHGGFHPLKNYVKKLGKGEVS